MVWMTVGWLIAIAAVVWLVARVLGGRDLVTGRPGGRDDAEAILRERYARGEIDEVTYRPMLEELRRER